MLHVTRSIVCGLYLTTALAGEALSEPMAAPISNVLTAQRVVRVGGAEHLEPAATGRPGDVIQYTVQFHNSGVTAAHALQATLPIPSGVVLIPGSVQPANVRASLDGTTFAPMPLLQRVRRPDGSVADEPVPAAQIRFLRWAPAELTANGSLAVSARVVLQGNADTATPH